MRSLQQFSKPERAASISGVMARGPRWLHAAAASAAERSRSASLVASVASALLAESAAARSTRRPPRAGI